MFICLLPWFSPQVSTHYHEFRSVSIAVAWIADFIRKFSLVIGLYSWLQCLKQKRMVVIFLCMYMHVSNIFIHCVVHIVKERNLNRKFN